jgi:hypothetical protein
MRSIRPVAPFIPYVLVLLGLFWWQNAWLAVLGFHGALITILFIDKPSIPILTLIRSNSLPMLIGAVVLCGLSGVVLYLAWPLLGASKDLSVKLAALGLSPTSWPLFIGYFVLVNPWLEEYFWRGYLGSLTGGLAQIDFLFAGYHLLVIYDKISWGWLAPAFAALVFGGWLWRQATRKSNGLLVSSLSHMAADFSILTSVYLISIKG